jgi:hypothetical protein
MQLVEVRQQLLNIRARIDSQAQKNDTQIDGDQRTQHQGHTVRKVPFLQNNF